MVFNSISFRSPRTKTSAGNGANKNKNKRNRSKKSKTKLTVSIEKDVFGGPPLTPIKSPTKRSSRSSLRIQTNSSMSSLGRGALSQDGGVTSFIPSPEAKSKVRSRLFSPSKPISDHPICYDGIALAPTSTTSTVSLAKAKSRIIGRCCSFLRVSDLEMEMDDESMTTMSITSDSSNEPQEHTFRPVVNPPPGIEIDPKERWVALCTTFDDNDSNGAPNTVSTSPEHTPIAPLAMKRLANFGLTTTLNEVMWQADSKSEKMFKKASGDNEWMKQTFLEGLKEASTCPESSSDVLIWTGSFKHGFYGSEVPAVRSAGVVDTSAKKLLELLVDSTRVKEYNKISLGRQDLVTFGGNMEMNGPFGKSITKVMKSVSKPPMVSNLALTSILHAKKLPDGSGYLIVSRAVHRPEEESSLAASVKTEIVMGVNLIVDFDSSGEGGAERCLMVNVNHMYSPMIPVYIAKKLGLSTARKFIDDIRAIV